MVVKSWRYFICANINLEIENVQIIGCQSSERQIQSSNQASCQPTSGYLPSGQWLLVVAVAMVALSRQSASAQMPPSLRVAVSKPNNSLPCRQSAFLTVYSNTQRTQGAGRSWLFESESCLSGLE